MNKFHLALILLVLLACSMLSVSTINLGKAENGTQVSGIIAADTAWTKENSPYALTGNILVDNGVTLTIQEGAIVNLNDFYIHVNGSFQAVGNDDIIEISDGEIVFSENSMDWNNSNGKGCIIQNCNFSFTSLSVSSAPLIQNNNFFGAGPSSTITYGDIYSEKVSDSALIIQNNTFCGESYRNAITLFLGTSFIQNNRIMNYQIGIHIENGSSQIVNNTISSCDLAINIPGYSYSIGHSNITGNLIVNNGDFSDNIIIGLAVSRGGVCSAGSADPVYVTNVCNNTISANTYGIVVDDAPAYLANNNIFGNTRYNIQRYDSSASPNREIIANESWWGTTNSESINQTIYDFKNDFNLGIVNFVPYLTAPNQAAPTYVDVSSSGGGTIKPAGVTRLNYGESQTFVITPNTGYIILDVLVNGSYIGATTSYTVQNIGGATTIEVLFLTNPPPSPSPSPTPVNPTAQPTSNPTSNPASNPTTKPTYTPTAKPSSTPAVPEFSWLVIVPLLFVVFSVTLIIRHRKTVNRSK